MPAGWSDSATPLLRAAFDRACLFAGGAWRRCFRFVAVVLVGLVVFTAARQVPSPGARSAQTPPTDPYMETARLGAWLGAAPDPPSPVNASRTYAWLSRRSRAAYEPLAGRIDPPEGFARVKVSPGSFAEWLRHLPVAPPDRPVTNAKRKTVIPAGDASLAAVIDLQPGAGNLLLAPAMMVRLRAEYLWSAGKTDGLAFHFTSGHASTWADWAAGDRPSVKGKLVAFRRERPPDDSRDNFCSYLETLFRYTTVYSLLQDSEASAEGTIAPGDMFIQTGRAAHALMVLDVAVGPGGRVKALLGQGGNPAQTFHVLRAADGSPWFGVTASGGVAASGGRSLRLKDLRHWRSP